MRGLNQNNTFGAYKPVPISSKTFSNLEDSAIAQLWQSNPEAIDYIFNRYYNQLCNISFKIVNDEDAAEDIVQELITDIWRKRETLNITYSLGAYLKRSAKNRSLNYLRDHGNRMVPLDEETVSSGTYEINEELYPKDLKAIIDRFIETLPAKCGEVFILNKIERLTYNEIAESLKISVKTVENHLLKAKRLAKERLCPCIILSGMVQYYRFCRS